MNSATDESSTQERFILLLLGGQGFFIGVGLAFLYVAANTLFLVGYGSEMLPYVYIAVGIFASLTFYGYAELQRRWSLMVVGLTTNSVIAAIFFVAYFILTLPNTAWVAIGLMVFFLFAVQMAFVLLGAQAGQLLDIRQIKRLFPMVAAILNTGFITASLSVSALLPILGRVENLLLISGGCILVALLLLIVGMQRFRSQFSQSPQPKGRSTAQPKSLSQLIRKRYVSSIFIYQVLSAIGTQLVAYLLITLADARYTNPDDLARFFGNFAAARNILNVLFMIFLAGQLLSRFGLSFGLTANPVVVGLIVALMVGVNLTTGQGDLIFWLAVAAVSMDVILSEAITNTSLKTSYQALLSTERLVVEAGIEGIGVPVAIGTTGLLLILFNAIPGLTFSHIIMFTVFIIVLWTASAFLVYRDYAGTLLKTLSRRALGEVALSLDDESSLVAVESLLQSSNLRDIRLALDMLAEAEHDSLDTHLIRLIEHEDAAIRAEALVRLEQRRVETAWPVIETRLPSETNPPAKGAALRTLCALKEAEAVEVVTTYLNDPDPDIRLGAMAGLLRYGGIPGVVAAWEYLKALEQATDPAQRIFVARVIGQVGISNFYQPLLPLLKDQDVGVRQAALVAARQVRHRRLLPLIIDNLPSPGLRSAAMAALVAGGEHLLPIVAKALAGQTEYETETITRLVRACAQIKGERVMALLRQHLDHADNNIQYQVLMALERCGFRAGAGDLAEIEQTLAGQVEHGLRVLMAKQSLGSDETLTLLHRALDDEFAQVRRRVFLLLSFLYEARPILRAEEQLARGNSSAKALALETLDVTLSSQQKALVFPLVDPKMSLAQRIRQLSTPATLPELNRDECLAEIITNPAGVWSHAWTRACAIYAAAHLSLAGLAPAIEAALALTEPPIQETAAWALHRLAPGQYQL